MNTSVGGPPLYQQIYTDLEKKISSGELSYMEQLPVLPDLCRLYGVSEAPVRRALDELERAGLILRQRGRGKGTFVRKQLSQRTMRVLLMDEINIYRNPIEYVHEIFDIIAGIREEARSISAEAPLISPSGYDTLAPARRGTGYLVLAQGRGGFETGHRLAADQHAPCVLVNTPTAQTPCVRVDMELGAFLGVNYLVQLGHTRIAYVGPQTGAWFQPRFDGYRRALEKAGIAFDTALVCSTDGRDAEQDEQALDALMGLAEPPTAIFAASDYRALHLLAGARKRGISIPGQLSLCGYDDISEVAAVEPALTTVRHPHYELGREAVSLLARLLSDETLPESALDVLVPPQVAVRGSCAAPPQAR